MQTEPWYKNKKLWTIVATVAAGIVLILSFFGVTPDQSILGFISQLLQ